MKHMSSAHADYWGHFSSQFVYTTNEINKDEDCYYADDYANNDNSSTNNYKNPPSPSHVAPSAFPLLPDWTASPDTAYIKHMDIDQDFNYGNKDTSSSSDIPYSTFFEQSHLQANCPNTGCKTAPKEQFTRTYHSKLNGECWLFLNSVSHHVEFINRQDMWQGQEWTSTQQSLSTSWFWPTTQLQWLVPLQSCIQFKLADFLYCHNQMLEGDADFLFNLMNAMLASHGNCAPFHNHSDMHITIDATTLGEAPWDHFTLNYTGPLPEGISRENTPGWMTEDHEVWFHNPVTLLENLLANPNFKDKFDCMPYQKIATDVRQLVLVRSGTCPFYPICIF